MFRTAERGGRQPGPRPGAGPSEGAEGPGGAARRAKPEDTAGPGADRASGAGARPLTDRTRDAWRHHETAEASRGSLRPRVHLPRSPTPPGWARRLLVPQQGSVLHLGRIRPPLTAGPRQGSSPARAETRPLSAAQGPAGLRPDGPRARPRTGATPEQAGGVEERSSAHQSCLMGEVLTERARQSEPRLRALETSTPKPKRRPPLPCPIFCLGFN